MRDYYKRIFCSHAFILLVLLFNVSLNLAAQINSSSQSKVITGVVRDDSSYVEGVTVSTPDNSVQTVTNNNGTFSITVPTAAKSLRFSSVGYNSTEVKLGNNNNLIVTLAKGARQLDAVVVVSYGTQRNKLVTGSIAQVNASTLQDMPVGQFAQQLQGKVAGVQIAQSSGQPGRGMEFRIRGAASLFAENQPLFVVDGIPVTGSINNINPTEIETFTVLKDASASSLYGSRAANGVILITTKRARPGDSRIEFSSNYGIQKLPENRVPKMMTARGFAQFMKERHEDRMKYEGVTTPVDSIYTNPEQYGEGTNWFKTLTQTAPIQNYDLTIQSARERSSTTVIAGYQSQEGVIINTGTQLFSLRLNHELTLSNNKIKIGFNVAPSYRKDHNNRLPTDGVGGLFERIFESSPLIAPVNPDGTMPKFVFSPGMVTYLNPYAEFTLSKDDYLTTRILGNTYLNYEFLKDLSLQTNLGVDKGAETRNQFSPSLITTNSIATGLSSSVDNYSWTAEANLNYSKTFFKDHNIEALAGYSAQRFEQVSNSVSATNFPGDEVPYLSAATAISAGTSNTTQFSLLSTIARLNYNYKGKYLLSGAIRRDGSSRFGGS